MISVGAQGLICCAYTFWICHICISVCCLAKLLQIINSIYEYLRNAVRKHLAQLSALDLVQSGTNKGVGRMQWGEKSSTAGRQESFLLLFLPKALSY